jgi:hypothetical protein
MKSDGSMHGGQIQDPVGRLRRAPPSLSVALSPTRAAHLSEHYEILNKLIHATSLLSLPVASWAMLYSPCQVLARPAALFGRVIATQSPIFSLLAQQSQSG